MTLSLPAPEPWMDDALCAQIGGDHWFPEKGQHGIYAQAKAMCRRCPARDACLRYALRHDIRDGVWGGLSPRERQRIRWGRAA